MMYRIKSIILHDEDITLPQCMYKVKKIFNFNDFSETNENCDLKISEQVLKFLKVSSKDMAELESRQDLLLKKLDALYERITKISSICSSNDIDKPTAEKCVQTKVQFPMGGTVINVNPDNLPWYLLTINKITELKVTWHIHSSVTKDKLDKVKAFAKYFKRNAAGTNVDIRLIFTDVTAETELKLSSLKCPILADVNILRYLSIVLPEYFPFCNNFKQENLLDLCYLLEKAPEKGREEIAKKLFINSSDWIYNNEFSIVDIAAHNVVKQWRSRPKYVPNKWFQNIEKIIKPQ